MDANQFIFAKIKSGGYINLLTELSESDNIIDTLRTRYKTNITSKQDVLDIDFEKLEDMAIDFIQDRLRVTSKESKDAETLEREIIEDVKNARDNNKFLINKDKRVILFMSYIEFLVITSFIAMGFVLMIIDVPIPNKELVYMMLGIIGAKFGTIIDYKYGSSGGSDKKNDIIHDLSRRGNEHTR
jgi:hypothetical protein